jgi:AraC-like DNA-binding protein
MKPLFQVVEPLIQGSISVKEIKTNNLNDQFHFHNLYEIALIIKGSGKRIVGDSIENFTDGDLVFIGHLIPHASYIGEGYTPVKNCQEVHALVIYFHPDWFDESILNTTDFLNFMKLIKKLERGISLLGNTKTRTTKALLKLKNTRGLERIIKLLDILDFVSKSDEYKCLASESYSNSYSKSDVERLSAVYKYIMKNYTDVIKLDDISNIANMTATSFCKYFKCKTGKTFSNFVNEVRIGQACKLFFNENMYISQVCYSCGFNNLTNFNKNFKHFTGMTPTLYKNALNINTNE